MEAMQRGENWALPRKDQGPVRALARDDVDSRRGISEYYLFGVVVLIVLLFIPALRKSAVIDYVGAGPAAGDRGRGLARRQPGDAAGAASASPARAPAGVRHVHGHARHPAAPDADAHAPGQAAATRSEPGRRLARRRSRSTRLTRMEYRHLGRSGLKISEIAYGNWITHGSQVEEDAARACVAAALDEGITTFDTADVYAGTRAEEVLGRALHGVRRESLEIFTKVLLADRPGRRTTAACPASTSWSPRTPRCAGCRPTTSTCTRPTATTTRRRSRRPCAPSTTWSARARCCTSACPSGGPRRSRPRCGSPSEMGFDRIVSNQPQYNMIWRVIESEVIPLCEKEGIGQIVWSPIAQGVLTGKYLPGAAAAGRARAPPTSAAPGSSRGYLTDDAADPGAAAASRSPSEAGLTLAQLAVAWTLQNPNVVGRDRRRHPARAGAGERQAVRRPARPGAAARGSTTILGPRDRHRPGRRRRARRP